MAAHHEAYGLRFGPVLIGLGCGLIVMGLALSFVYWRYAPFGEANERSFRQPAGNKVFTNREVRQIKRKILEEGGLHLNQSSRRPIVEAILGVQQRYDPDRVDEEKGER